MAKTLREVIKNTIYSHLKIRNGLVFGQCLTAVGWVGGNYGYNAIWVNRNNNIFDNLDYKPNSEIKDLSELISLI